MTPVVSRSLALAGAALLWAGQALAAVTSLGAAPNYYPGAAAPVWKVGDNLLLVREFNFGEAYDLARLDPATGAVSALKDIHPGSQADLANPAWAVMHQGLLYFWANDPVRGLSLWRTDGTSAGTLPFMDLITDQGLAADALPLRTVSVDDHFLLVFTSAGTGGTARLWRIDTEAGTAVRLLSSPTGELNHFQRVGDELRFLVGRTLWTSDGSADSAVAISGDWFYGPYVALAGKSLQIRHNALQEVNLADGTLTPLHTPDPSSDGWRDVSLKVGSRFLFDANGLSPDESLWISDGSAGGTVRLTNRLPWYAKDVLRFKGGALYPAHTATDSFELRWVDGSTGSSTTLATLAPTSDYYPLRMKQAGNLAFVLKHSDCCVKLWTTDGTAAGTREVYSRSRRPDQSWDLIGGSDERFYLSLTDYAGDGISRIQVYTPGATATGGGGGGGALSPWLLGLLALGLAWRRRR